MPVDAPSYPLGFAVLDHGKEQVSNRFRTLTYMSYILTLLASLDARLDELATEISTLEGGRAALRTPIPAASPTALAPRCAAPPGRRPGRGGPQAPPWTRSRARCLRRRTVRAPTLPNPVGEPPRKRP